MYIERVEKVQRRFTNQIFGRNGMFSVSYRDRLAFLGTTSLRLRRTIYDQSLLFKIVFDLIEIEKNELFDFYEFSNRTRGHALRIYIGRIRSQQFFESFLVRATKTWNKLPSDLVSSSTPASFSRRLESYLKEKGFF